MSKWLRPSFAASFAQRWSRRQGSRRASRRVVAAALTIGGSILFGASSALASPGCTALNGTFGPNFVETGSRYGTGFEAGDVITVTGTVFVNNNRAGVVDIDGGFAVLSDLQDDPGTVIYVVPANTDHQFGIGYSASGTTQFHWSCVSAAGKNTGPTPSQKLAALQASVTPVVATTSAQAITGAIDGAINDAFSPGGAFIRGSAGGFAINFAAEPKSNVVTSAGKAFDALAYAGGMPAKAPASPAFDRVWSLWADVRGTGWNHNDANSGFSGRQINVTAGLGRRLTSDWLVGIVGGYENFNYDVASLTGTLKGHGGTVGGYTAYRFTPSLRWDGALTWSHVNYDASVTGANGSFTGSRFIASTGLTGTYRWLAVILEPSAKVFALWEKQGAWTDSLGTAQAQRDFSAGRVAVGGRVLYPWLEGPTSVSPYIGAYGDWRFGSNNLSSGTPVIGVENGWSGRVTGGLNIARQGGGTVTLGGEYGGIGADYKLWSAQARVLWPF